MYVYALCVIYKIFKPYNCVSFKPILYNDLYGKLKKKQNQKSLKIFAYKKNTARKVQFKRVLLLNKTYSLF
jgi:ribonuclease HIII